MLRLLHLLLFISLLGSALAVAVPATSSTSPASVSLLPSFNGTSLVDDDCTYAGLSETEVEAHRAAYATLGQSTVQLKACPGGFDRVISIPVYFHVIHWEGRDSAYEYVPPADIKVTIANLNKQFAAYKPRFRFVHKSTTFKKYTDYNTWAAESVIHLPLYTKGNKQIRALAAHFRGSSFTSAWAKELHVYSTWVSGAYGFSFRPNPNKTPFLHDGVWVDSAAVKLSEQTPGKAFLPTTLVHEVGHWLGLQHTFAAPPGVDPCSFPSHDSTHGDLVFDTPKWTNKPATSELERGSTSCPAAGRPWSQTRSPCPGKMSLGDIQTGISNYLSYSNQVCRSRFTPGQLTLMLKTAVNIRKFVPTCQKLA